MNCRSAQKIRYVEPANIAKGSLEVQRGPTYVGRGLSHRTDGHGQDEIRTPKDRSAKRGSSH